MRVHGSGGRLCDLANLCSLPAWTGSLVPQTTKIIPRNFRIMIAQGRTLQGMARVRSGQATARGARSAATLHPTHVPHAEDWTQPPDCQREKPVALVVRGLRVP